MANDEEIVPIRVEFVTKEGRILEERDVFLDILVAEINQTYKDKIRSMVLKKLSDWMYRDSWRITFDLDNRKMIIGAGATYMRYRNGPGESGTQFL